MDRGNVTLVGLTGSIATGKSTVANMFTELGADQIDFDLLAREVVEPDKPAWEDILELFSEVVLNEDRSLNRKILSAIVFNDASKRKALEQIVHPRIQMSFIEKVKKIELNNPSAIIMAVVPLLIEVNMVDQFNKIIVVVADPNIQLRRLMERDDISEKVARNIISSQIPVSEKTKYADYIVNNGDSMDETRIQVETVWRSLRSNQTP